MLLSVSEPFACDIYPRGTFSAVFLLHFLLAYGRSSSLDPRSGITAPGEPSLTALVTHMLAIVICISFKTTPQCSVFQCVCVCDDLFNAFVYP